MIVRKNFVDTIGNTPLIRLTAASEATGCDIYGKAEFLNPGGSVKDRAALAIIEDAEEKGLLEPGGVIVEGTAGNTGIGLSLVANAKGYKTVIVMPETQTDEKKALLRYCGADLRLVPAKPYKDPGNYVKYSGRLAEEIAASSDHGAIWANQFDNVANKLGHFKTTGPEIFEQTAGKVDGFICAVGSGGTLAGIADALRARKKDVKIGIADPMGAALYEYYKNGELKSSGSSISEGIGQGRITANLEGLTVDMPYQIDDVEALNVLYDLNIKEGLQLGLSSGVNVAGAIRMAQEMGPGHTIVTILCDTAQKYFSKLMDVDMLAKNNLPIAPWLKGA